MKSKFFLIIVVALLSGFSLTAQTIYEFHYYFEVDNVRENYKAFLYRNGDGTGYIRVVGEKPHILVHMMMEEFYENSDEESDAEEIDSSVLVFEGYEPKTIDGQGTYIPDIFLFQKNETTGYFEPYSVLSRDDEGKNEVAGVIETMKLINDEDLTEEFVLQYFTKRDEFYINRFQNTVRALTTAEQAIKLHLIVVANTEDASVGESTKIDRRSVVQLFKQVTQKLKIGFTSKEIFGDTYNKRNVEAAITNIRAGSKDIIVFYYSGHGFNPRGQLSAYPAMDLREGSHEDLSPATTMTLTEAFSRIKAKNARLNLVISDCCNTDAPLAKIETPGVATTKESRLGWTESNCRALFLEPKKSILLAAASKGEYAGGNPATGGIFTFQLRETMEKLMGPSSGLFGATTWEDVVKSATTRAQTKAAESRCQIPGGAIEQCKQKAVVTIE